jgi:hypothetical protein
LNQYLVVAIAAALLVLTVYRQMRTQPIQPRPLIVPPAILVVFGFYTIQGHPPNSAAAGVALGSSAITALAFGVARGVTTTIWLDHGGAMRKGTTTTLMLWIAAIAVRIAIGLVARHAGGAVQPDLQRNSAVSRAHTCGAERRDMAARNNHNGARNPVN